MGNIGLPFGLTKDHISLEKYTFPYLRKDRSEWPSDREESPFEPLEGFPNGRKERVMIATQAEMDSAKLTPPFRDYCAHKWIDYRACLKNNRPFYWRCRHERHSYGECVFEDSVLRMKEWEREKRLRQREKRLEKEAL